MQINCVNPMKNSIDISQLRDAAARTQMLPAESWGNTGWSEDQVRVRDGFLDLVRLHDCAVFEEFKTHPFWLNWASKSSARTNNILYFALGSAQDPSWIKKLSDTGVSTHAHFLQQVCRQKFENIVPILKICQNIGLFKLDESSVNQHLFHYFVGRGSLEFIEYVWENNLFTQRFNGAANDLAVFASKRWFTGNRVEVLKTLWDKWGQPNADEYRQLFDGIGNFCFSGQSSRGTAYNFVAAYWNSNHPQWNDFDSKAYLKKMFKRGSTEATCCLLEKNLNEGMFSEQVWSEALSEMQEMSVEKHAVFSHLYLSFSVKNVSTSRVKRM